MEPDGCGAKGQRQRSHLPNGSVLLCLTAISAKGSFNVPALDLSQECRGSAFASPSAVVECFLCIKAKQLNFHSSVPLAVARVCFDVVFPSPKFSFAGLGRGWKRHLST